MHQLRKCLGVDLGTSSVKIAEVSLEKSGVRVTRMLSRAVDLPPGPMDATRQSAVIQCVRDLLKENKITTKQAVFCLPGQSVFIRQIVVPRTSEERMRRIVAYEAKQQIPFALENSIMEYQVFDLGNPNEVKVLLAAAKLDTVNEYMKFIEKTGLTPVAVSVSSMALFNFHVFDAAGYEALLEELQPGRAAKKRPTRVTGAEVEAEAGEGAPAGAPPKKGFAFNLPKFDFSALLGKKKAAAVADAAGGGESGPEPRELGDDYFGEDEGLEEIKAFVGIGASAFDLVIARFGKHKVVGFPRSVPWGSNDLNRSLQEKLGLPSVEEAEAVKRERAMVILPGREDEIEALGADPDASEFATSWADRLVLDLRKSFDYYISQPDGMAVDSIVLTGGGAQLRNLPEYIEEKLGIPVTVKTELETKSLSLPPDSTDLFLSGFVIATGLALTGLGLGRVSVDFLPPEQKTIREFKRKNVELGLLVGAIVAMLAISTQVGQADIENKRAFLDRESGTIQRANQVRAELEKAKQERQAVSDRITLLSKVMGDRAFWLEFLGVLQAAKPADIVIRSLTMRPDGTVELIGETKVLGSISTFQENLIKEKKWIDGKPELSSPRRQFSPLINEEVFAFRMTMKARGKITRLADARQTLLPGLTAPTPAPTVAPMPGMVPGAMPPGGVPPGGPGAAMLGL
jgi:Tfp pilus assembly PilM family ATPase